MNPKGTRPNDRSVRGHEPTEQQPELRVQKCLCREKRID